MHQTDRQAGGGAHVAHVGKMHRRDAAQRAMRHIQLRAVMQCRIVEHWHRLVTQIGNHPDALLQVQPPGLGRHVRGGIAKAEIRLQAVIARFRDDLAIAALAEAVRHDPVIAGQCLQPAHGQIAQRDSRRCEMERLQHRLHHGERRAMGEFFHRLDVDAEQGTNVVGTQMQRFVLRRRQAIHVARSMAALRGQRREHVAGCFSQRFSQLAAQRECRRDADDRREIGAGMGDAQVVEPRNEHGAVRLDRARDVDGFLGASHEVECRRRNLARVHHGLLQLHGPETPPPRHGVNQARMASNVRSAPATTSSRSRGDTCPKRSSAVRKDCHIGPVSAPWPRRKHMAPTICGPSLASRSRRIMRPPSAEPSST